MTFLIAVAPWVILIPIISLICKRIYDHYVYNQTMYANGCSVPPQYKHRDPILGLDLFIKSMRYMKEGNYFDLCQTMFREYGKTYASKSWGRTVVHTMDPKNMQVVLSSCSSHFAVEPIRRDALERLLGKGVFTSDGYNWEHSRGLINPIFAKAYISDLSSLDLYVTRVLDLIPRDRSTVDLQPLFKRLFLDVSTDFVFGASNAPLASSADMGKTDEFLGAFEQALRGVGIRMFFGKFRFLFGGDGAANEACARVHEVVDGFINDALRNRQDSRAGRSKSYNLLSELGQSSESRLDLRHQVLNVFLPGYDSTAIGLSDVFFQLARDSRVWTKLRQEVIAIDHPITLEAIRSMKYLKNVLNESFRLISPIGRNMRMCVKDCILLNGGGTNGQAPIIVKRGTEVNMVFRAMQRDPDLWGLDAAKFRPERWEERELRSTWEYMPFSRGARACPAQQMALLECGYVVIRFLQEFERMENRDPQLEFIEEHRVTMQSRNGVKVALISAS